MSDFAIVTDSTAYIPQDLIDKYHIHVAPQVLIWGEESYLDGVDIQPGEFYQRLEETDVYPTTSQATVVSFHTIFEPLVGQQIPILAIVISEKLSGTLQSAQQAKAMFPGAKIELVDSQSTAMAMGFQVLAAARARERGASFEKSLEIAKGAHNQTGVFFVVDTLEYLHRGGRIGGASKLFGTALNIKPLLQVTGGRVESFEKIRTKSKAIERMLDVVEERLDGEDTIRIAALHAAAESEAVRILEAAKKRLDPVEAMISVVSPVVGNHAGPGTVGLVYSTV
ncbi:MAG: DegV family protein [Anaerolineales bacterium]|nr:DegV family protein [Anaerolineales bacterium]